MLAAQGGASGLANQLGDPRAARSIARANAAESLRSIEPKPMAVSNEVPLQKESAFSVGVSGGIGLSIGGAPSAAGGSFQGLRSPVETSISLGDPRALFSVSAGSGLSASTGAGFSVGGLAGPGSAGSACTDVGNDADLASLIRFV